MVYIFDVPNLECNSHPHTLEVIWICLLALVMQRSDHSLDQELQPTLMSGEKHAAYLDLLISLYPLLYENMLLTFFRVHLW